MAPFQDAIAGAPVTDRGARDHEKVVEGAGGRSGRPGFREQGYGARVRKGRRFARHACSTPTSHAS